MENLEILFNDIKFSTVAAYIHKDGWFNLIIDFLKEVSLLQDKYKLKVVIGQIKEKFGILCIYANIDQPEITDLEKQIDKNGDEVYVIDKQIENNINLCKKELYLVIDEYTKLSGEICSKCGIGNEESENNAVTTEGKYWIVTLCKKCRDERNLKGLEG